MGGFYRADVSPCSNLEISKLNLLSKTASFLIPQPLPHGTLMPDLPPSDPRKRKLPLPAFAAAAKAKAATTASSAKTATVAPAKSAASLAAAAASASAAIVSTAATAAASVLPKKRVDPRLTHRKLKIEARDTYSILYI